MPPAADPRRYVTRHVPAITATPDRRDLVPVRQPMRAPIASPTDTRRALPRGVSIVPNQARRPMRPMPSLHPLHPMIWGRSRTPRPRRQWWGVALVAVVLLVGLAHAIGQGSANPLTFDGLASAAGRASHAASPLGRQIADADVGDGGEFPDAAANPWQAGAFSVPVLGGGGAAAPGALAAATPVPQPPKTTAAPAPTTAAPKPTTKPATTSGGVSPAPFTPWPPRDPWMRVPGYTAYRVYDYRGDPYAAAFGQCTWWAQHERRDQNLRGLGNARYWASNAARRGYRVGDTPAKNATVVFQPYVQGASPVGHVGHVIAVYPGGWFLMSEMNAYGNGGGWGRVSYRYAHAGPGVKFIY